MGAFSSAYCCKDCQIELKAGTSNLNECVSSCILVPGLVRERCASAMLVH
jgi:hypothetical protein